MSSSIINMPSICCFVFWYMYVILFGWAGMQMGLYICNTTLNTHPTPLMPPDTPKMASLPPRSPQCPIYPFWPLST